MNALLDDRDLLSRAINLGDDDVIEGCPKKGEELDCHDKIGLLPVDGAASAAHIVQNRLIGNRGEF